MKKLLLCMLAIIMVISLPGCMTQNPYTGEQEVSRATIGTGLGAVGGALVGTLVGGRHGTLIGAAAGGALGGITGSYMDRQNTELQRQLEGTGVQIIREGDYIQLNMASDVTFKFDRSDIKARFYSTLQSVAIILNKYRRTNIMVSGYTDNVGRRAYNQRLSERRAHSVTRFLISQGINPNRLFTKGYGMRRSIASNRTPRGRALNRRVEIVLRARG